MKLKLFEVLNTSKLLFLASVNSVDIQIFRLVSPAVHMLSLHIHTNSQTGHNPYNFPTASQLHRPPETARSPKSRTPKLSSRPDACRFSRLFSWLVMSSGISAGPPTAPEPPLDGAPSLDCVEEMESRWKVFINRLGCWVAALWGDTEPNEVCVTSGGLAALDADTTDFFCSENNQFGYLKTQFLIRNSKSLLFLHRSQTKTIFSLS